MADSVTSHMAAYPIGAGVQVLLNPCAPHCVRLLGVHLLEHLVDVDGVGLAPLLLALQALGALDARLSPRVTGRTPSHPYAPAERRAHQCMTEGVSPLHTLHVASTTIEGLHCRKRRRREACTHCSLCSAVLPRSTVHSFEGQVCGGVAGGHGLSAVAAQSRWQDRGLSSSPPVTTPCTRSASQ